MEEQKCFSCMECSHLEDWTEYGDYGSVIGGYVYACGKHPNKSNLKQFPFRKAPEKCFQLDFWQSEFATHPTLDEFWKPLVEVEAFKLYEEKYLKQ